MENPRLWMLVFTGLMLLAAACGGTVRVGRLRVHLGWLALSVWAGFAAMAEAGNA